MGLLLLPALAHAQESQDADARAKALSNPIAVLINIPLLQPLASHGFSGGGTVSLSFNSGRDGNTDELLVPMDLT